MLFFNKKKKPTSTIELGTLYDMNKSLIEQGVTALTKEELENKKELILDWLLNTNNEYYMLLCNERKDYTVFRLTDLKNKEYDDCRTDVTNILIDECLFNRGNTKSIELTENKDAVEIWISIDGESYCYYFFPYDAAIIEC